MANEKTKRYHTDYVESIFSPATEAERQKPYGSLPKDTLITHVLFHKGIEEGYTCRTSWVIYLQITDTMSFKLQLLSGTPDDEIHRPMLRVSPDCVVPSPNADLVFPVQGRVTIQSAVLAINVRRHAVLRFTNEQQASKFWLYTLMMDMEDRKIVKKGSSQVVWDRMENDRPSYVPLILSPPSRER